MISLIAHTNPLIRSFEDGSLNIREFDHRKHVYIAWVYLGTMSFNEALERYVTNLKALLEKNGKSYRFSQSITEGYFSRIDTAMKKHPTRTFDEFMSLTDLK